MEKSIKEPMQVNQDNFAYFKEIFHIEHKAADSYSPLALAYIGDSVFDVMIRTIFVSRVNRQTNKYHKDVSKIVCARAQAEMITGIMDALQEDEIAVFKRGRNANSYSKAKNASRSDYRKATGFEALIGYLYLNEDFTRITDVVNMGLAVLEHKEN